VTADTVAGSRLRITGTPALLINSHLTHGLPPEQTLIDLVERALKSK
jgi:protein-disulfide isomerase